MNQHGILTMSCLLRNVRKADWYAGGKAASPLLLGVVPFGLIYGATAVDAGFTWWYAVLNSVCIYAGASQLAVLQLLSQDTPFALALLAGLVINVRMLLYSASLAPHLHGLSLFHKGMLAHFLTDQAYAVSLARFSSGHYPGSKGRYYFGAALTIFGGFFAGTTFGAILGTRLPDSMQLHYAVPLTFLALLTPLLKKREGLLTAATAGGVALLCRGLPYNCGILPAIAAGIAVGCLLDAPSRSKER